MSGKHFPITVIGDTDHKIKQAQTVERLLMNAGMPVPKPVATVYRLRALHPDRVWKVVRVGWGRCDYVSGGWTARWVADLEDDGDVGSPSRLCIYKDDGPPEWVY